MVVGFRVVRGRSQTEDRHRDVTTHEAGTITDMSKKDNSVEVTWDSGKVTSYTVGQGGTEGIQVFDSGPRGILHRYIRCEGCDVTDIIGTRWRCSVCENVSLCTPCYHDDCHDKKHPFLRIDFPGSQSVKVGARSTSHRARITGMYPDAKVTIGRHWEGQFVFGGPGSTGTIVDIVDYKGGYSCRSGVSVTWPDETTRDYRVGHDGKVDLCCDQAAPGADYYNEHIAAVDIPQFTQWQDDVEVIQAGDRVYIDRPSSEVGEWLRAKGSWSGNVNEFEGAVGIVKAIQHDGNPVVDFNFTTVAMDKKYLGKVPSHSVGDAVRVLESKDKLQMLQEKHGGWEEDLEQVMGKLGIVKVIDADCDVAVSFGRPTFVFHPASLIPAPGETQVDTGAAHQTSTDGIGRSGPSHSNITQDSIRVEPTPDFLQSFGGLAFLQAFAHSQAQYKDKFVRTVIENRETEAKALIQQHPDLKDLTVNGIPCLSIAAHQGHRGMIATLLDAGCKIDTMDTNMCTPLHVAIQAQNGDAAMVLIERGANISSLNNHKHTPLHVAALLNMPSVVKVLLGKKANPNVQDREGDTPLHCAIFRQHDQTAVLLIQHLSTNLWLKNTKCFNTLAFACLRGCSLSVEKLITRDPQLVNSQLAKGPDGFMPLHIAVANNHIQETTLLLEKGKADVHARSISAVTPLHLTAKEAYYTVSEMLLKKGADTAAKDSAGDTPLHMCLRERRSDAMALFGLPNQSEEADRLKVAILLIQHNAGLGLVNNRGNKPLDECRFPRIREGVMAFVKNREPPID